MLLILIGIFFPYRGMLDSTKNDHEKQNESKEKFLPARRIQHLGRSIKKDEANDTNDQIPHISDHNVQYFSEKQTVIFWTIKLARALFKIKSKI